MESEVRWTQLPEQLNGERGQVDTTARATKWRARSGARNSDHVSELLVQSFGRPVLLYRDKMPRAREMAVYGRDGYGAFPQPKFECGCCEMLFWGVCGVRQNIYVYSLYRNPDLDDRIFLLFSSLA